MRIRVDSRCWFDALVLLALVLVGVASFGFGAHWQSRRSRVGAGEVRHGVESVGIRAEFNPQSALLLGANELVRYHQGVFKEVIRAVHGRLPVFGFVNDENECDLGRALLDEAGLPTDAVTFIRHPLDSMWLRDFGPMFSRWSDGRVEVIDALYRNPDEHGERVRDDAFTGYIGRTLGLKVRRMPLVIEGGNLLSNGDGLMVSSTRVLNRPENRHLTREQIGAMMREYFGCRLWAYLRQLEGEPTGHIDFCLTFLRRNLVVVGQYDAAYDAANAAVLDEIADTLRGQPTSMGPMVVERIAMPPRSKEGYWRSYCNVLLCNGVILVPSYADMDAAVESAAHATYRRLVPNLKVLPVNCDSLVAKRGVLHCIGITVPGYVNVRGFMADAL